jgi:RNA 2',3'-cyclic 3'-phosphodiesterase
VNRIPGTLRLFFALQPPLEKSAWLVDRVTPLVARLEAQRVPAENLHATLCFIGAVAPEQLPRLRSVAASVRGRHANLRFDTLEHWQKPRVLCATAAENSGSAPARGLAESLAAAAIGAGFTPDVKPFRAHLTLARKVDAVLAAQCELPQPLVPPLLVQCERFVLMESRRGESGSIYSVVDSWPLYAADTDSWPANIQ